MLYMLLKPLLSFFHKKNVDIYNNIFKLHSKLTVALLLGFSLIVCATNFFGQYIDCLCDSNIKRIMETYCWIFGTFISNKDNDGSLQKELYTGVKAGHIPQDERNYQKYYQFVPFVLVFQSILFSIPAVIWKSIEGGRLSSLCGKIARPIITAQWDTNSKNVILFYLKTESYFSKTVYALSFILCEILNFCVVVVNILFLNWVFSKFLVNYAAAINVIFSGAGYQKWDLYTSQVFPKVAKCEMHFYGPSGSIEKRDALCILPLNILNEKIFAVVWFWFVIVFIISALNCISKILICIFPRYRLSILQAQARSIDMRLLKFITKGGRLGDWFILYKISKNVNPLIFRELIEEYTQAPIKKDIGKWMSGVEDDV